MSSTSSKSYLRYVAQRAFGVLHSGAPGALAVRDDGRRVLCPALESVVEWDLRTGNRGHSLLEAGVVPGAGEGPVAAVRPPAVTAVAARQSFVAAGYSDGSVRVFALPPSSG